MLASSKQPRPADLAIVGARLLTRFQRRIWKHNYKNINPNNMASALPVMLAAFEAMIATADGRPMTPTQLARKMKTPLTTVTRIIELLQKFGRIKIVNGRKRGKGHEKLLVIDLDQLDKKMTLDHVRFCINLIEDSLSELKLLSAVLMDELIANGSSVVTKVALAAWPAWDYVVG